MAKSTYKTKQKEELLTYMKDTANGHITAADVCEYFRQRGTPMGTATVYRQLERMVEEGVVQKYVVDEKSPACFQYVDRDACGDKEVCFHCKCEKCGKLIHMHCDELMSISSHLYEEHGFVLDPKRTVFYGLCDQCRLTTI